MCVVVVDRPSIKIGRNQIPSKLYLPISHCPKYWTRVGNWGQDQKIYVCLNDIPSMFRNYFPCGSICDESVYMLLSFSNCFENVSIDESVLTAAHALVEKDKKIQRWMKAIQTDEAMDRMRKRTSSSSSSSSNNKTESLKSVATGTDALKKEWMKCFLAAFILKNAISEVKFKNQMGFF